MRNTGLKYRVSIISVLHQIVHPKKLLVSSILFSFQKWKQGGSVQKIMRTNLIYCQQSLQNRPGLCPSISSTSSQNLNLMWRMISAIFDYGSCWSKYFLAKVITCWLRRTRRHQRLRWRRQRELECPTQTSGEKLIHWLPPSAWKQQDRCLEPEAWPPDLAPHRWMWARRKGRFLPTKLLQTTP